MDTPKAYKKWNSDFLVIHLFRNYELHSQLFNMPIRNCPWFMLCPLSTTMLSLLFFSTFLIQPSLSSMMDPITFSFPSFNSKSCSNGSLICMGSVTSAGDGYLSITPELQNQVGRVLYLLKSEMQARRFCNGESEDMQREREWT